MSEESKSGKPTLPADVTRCLGGGCADASNCQRYLARNEDFPRLSYIQGGAFVDGVCLYKIEPMNNQMGEFRRVINGR